MPKAQRKRSYDARFARDYRAITQCAQRSRAAPIRPRASNLLIVGTRSHEQPEKQSVIIARSAGRHSRQIAARYPRGRSCPVSAPRDGLCGPSVARRAAHHLSFSLHSQATVSTRLGLRVTQQCSFAVTRGAGRGAAPQRAHEISRKEHCSILRYTSALLIAEMTVG